VVAFTFLEALCSSATALGPLNVVQDSPGGFLSGFEIDAVWTQMPAACRAGHFTSSQLGKLQYD
jgi:hypothetical protein